MNLLQYAISLAFDAHRGQFDKGGRDYIEHPMNVMALVKGKGCLIATQIVAALHDTVEDTWVTLDHLRAAGFSEEVIEAVDCLSHRSGENREFYFKRIMTNEIAMHVKLADLEHNSDLARLGHPPTEREWKRWRRYMNEIKLIKQKMETWPTKG